jgi:hypothetical protein
MVTPVVLMVYNRPDITLQVMKQIAKAKPPILYILADGPKTSSDEINCNKTKEIALNPSWDCEVISFIQSENKGMVYQFLHGLTQVFKKYDSIIFLNDDSLVSERFYEYSTQLLELYNDNNTVGQINLTNLLGKTENEFSYFKSKRPVIWGFATWKRVWKTYDIKMSKWALCDKNKLLTYYYPNARERLSIIKMFNLHCDNDDPWTYDYQWDFNLMYNNYLCITPTINLCYNIGFNRNDSFHTKSINPFSNLLEKINNEISHPIDVSLNIEYDKNVSNLVCPDYIPYFISLLKRLIRKLIF